MNPAKKALARSMQFVSDHKVGITVALTATATVVVMDKLRGGALREAHEFIDARGLTDDFINSIAVNL